MCAIIAIRVKVYICVYMYSVVKVLARCFINVIYIYIFCVKLLPVENKGALFNVFGE